jgi:hypothetical protein
MEYAQKLQDYSPQSRKERKELLPSAARAEGKKQLEISDTGGGGTWDSLCCDWREAAVIFTAYQWGKPQP